MAKRRICFIAQFPPPMHGLAKAVDTLYNSEINLAINPKAAFNFEKIDITHNRKIIKNLYMISKSKANLFYFTISQTKRGNFRDLIILKLLQIQGKKCVIHLHGGYYRQLVDNDLCYWQRKANYTAIKRLAGVIVLGDSLKSIFKDMIDDKKIYVVPNCVDEGYLMNDEEFKEKVATIGDRKIKHVLYLSNFIKTKGYPEVLKMAKLEKERCEMANYANPGVGRKLHFDFAGNFFEKKEEEFFFRYIKENRLENYVTYHGIVEGDKKRYLLKKCDIFMLLTRYPKEGQPISILEAMGNGMLVVTTNHAGISDVVIDGSNGVMLKKDDKVTQSLLEEIWEPDIKLIIKAYQQIKERFTTNMYINNLAKIFGDAVLKSSN